MEMSVFKIYLLMLISSGWTHRKTFSMPVLRALSSETNTNSEIASSYRWYPTLPRREKIAGGVLGYKDLKKKEEKMLMISSGDPIGVQRGLAEQTWAGEAVCHKEELHRVQRQESQGDWDFLYRYRTLCHHNVKSKSKRNCVRKNSRFVWMMVMMMGGDQAVRDLKVLHSRRGKEVRTPHGTRHFG